MILCFIVWQNPCHNCETIRWMKCGILLGSAYCENEHQYLKLLAEICQRNIIMSCFFSKCSVSFSPPTHCCVCISQLTQKISKNMQHPLFLVLCWTSQSRWNSDAMPVQPVVGSPTGWHIPGVIRVTVPHFLPFVPQSATTNGVIYFPWNHNIWKKFGRFGFAMIRFEYPYPNPWCPAKSSCLSCI